MSWIQEKLAKISLRHCEVSNQSVRCHELQIITSTAAAHGCTAEVDWMEEAHPYYPPTVNDVALASFVKDVGAR